MTPPQLYGLLAEFETAEGIVRASRVVHQEGYRRLDAYTPYPMEEVLDALHLHHSHVPKVVLAGGIFGLLFGFGLQYYCQAVSYALNIGGRPIASWVPWVVPSFETTVLFSAFGAFFGTLALCGFPQPYHPVFNVPGFALASRDRFFLCIEASDPKFDLEATRQFLRSLDAVSVSEVQP